MGTIRFRLTLWHAAVFLLAGIVLLVMVNLLVQRAFPETDPGFVQRVADRPGAMPLREDLESLGLLGPRRGGPRPPASGPPADRQVEAILAFVEQGRVEARQQALRALLVQSSFALGVLLVLSVGGGWFLAGRVLSPISAITTTVQRIDAERLDRRIGMTGPRDEISELAAQFDAMLDRLDAAFQAQQEFVANASHELRTPLAVMRTELDVTFADPEATVEELRASADVVRRAIERSERLISALLTLERAQAPRQVDEMVDLADIARSVLGQHREAIDARGIGLREQLEPMPLTGDPILLERLVENLVSNAIAYNEPASDGSRWIEVDASSRDGVAHLRVANSSAPIDATAATRLFERFHRLDTSRNRETGGHGIGLAIVRAVARHHGGDAAVEVVPGPGIAFDVRLPLRGVAPGLADQPR